MFGVLLLLLYLLMLFLIQNIIRWP